MTDWFLELRPIERRQWTLVAISVALFLFHAMWFSTWQIEDAAITYAYARNFANGDGFVSNVGGEWVEGFSNPTWTLLLSFTTWLGTDPFAAGKLLGVLLAVPALPISYLWARRLQPSEDSLWPAFAPVVLALSNTATQWASSGLENGLIILLLSVGAWQLLREGDDRSWGWSGIPLGLLAWSRPEAPLYAGLLALIGAPSAIRAGGIRWLMSFVLLSAGPFFAWHAWRYWVFAWEFPNTYYAKLGESRFNAYEWNQRCWGYLRGWALDTGLGFMLPLYVIGMGGWKRWRAWLALLVVLFLVLLPGLAWVRAMGPFRLMAYPWWMMPPRWGMFGLVAILPPIVGWSRPAFRDRFMAWVPITAVIVFAVYAGGDWMKGYRFYAIVTVPLAVLLVDGARTIASNLYPLLSRWRWPTPERLTGLLILAPLLCGAGQTVAFLFHIDTTPFDVRRRVLYVASQAERLDLEHIRVADVDLGAHLYWSGFEMVDVAGLADVPVARHHYATAFVDSYFGSEKRPDFAHLHGAWARKSVIHSRPWFKREYVEMPPFRQGNGPKLHVGNHVHRRLFASRERIIEAERTATFGDLQLRTLNIPVPTVMPGGRLFVELAWGLANKPPPPFRAWLFLSNPDRTIAFELPPGYDFLEPADWRRSESVWGRHSLDLPADLPAGRWDIGLVVVGVGIDGEVIPADAAAPDPRHARGEVRWEGVIDVTTEDRLIELQVQALDALLDASAAIDCATSEDRGAALRRPLDPEHPWMVAHADTIRAARGRCFALRAQAEDTPYDITTALEIAPRDPEVRAIGRDLADRWMDEADAADANGDEEARWEGWRAAIRADPTRSWLRRRIETERTHRLESKSR